MRQRSDSPGDFYLDYKVMSRDRKATKQLMHESASSTDHSSGKQGSTEEAEAKWTFDDIEDEIVVNL